MPHILIIVSAKTSILTASCALAGRLVAAGHRVTFAAPEEAGSRVAAQGFAHVTLDVPINVPPDRGNPLVRLLRRKARRRRAVRAFSGQRVLDVVEDADPDAILIEIELHPAIITVVPTGRPTALLCSFLSIFRRPGIPPMHRTLLPRPGALGRLAVTWSWLTYRVWKWLFLRWRAVRRLGLDQTAVLRELAREMGFSFRRETDPHQWMLPFSYRRVPVIYVSPAELDFPHEPAAHEHHAGPMVDLDRPDPPMTPDDDARLEALVDRVRTEPAGRLAVCILSTVAAGDVDFTRHVITALGGVDRLDVVLGLGGRLAPSALGDLPPNTHVFRWLPVTRILPHASVALINAGPNAIAECVVCGVPIVVVSLDRNDQNGHAARVAFHGLGRRLDRRASPAEIQAAVTDVLDDPAYAARIAQMRERLAAYDRRQHAARMVETLLLSRAPEAHGG